MHMTQDHFNEIEFNLGNVALERAFLYKLLAEILSFPTNEMLGKLVSGELYERVNKAVSWVNTTSRIFNEQLVKMKELSQPSDNLDMENILKKMEEEYASIFLSTEDRSLSPYEGSYLIKEENVELLINNYEAETEFSLKNQQIMDHLENELLFLSYLCKKEGEAWHNGKSGKAKLWRRKERDFTVNHLGKWGEQFFADFEQAADLKIYKAIASFGKIYMKLEKGY